MKITEQELDSLEACQSAQDWREACDKIKSVRGQAYPDDWWDKVKLTGMMDRILGRWGADSSIRSVSFKNRKDVISGALEADEDYGYFGKHLFNQRNKNN